MLAAENLNVEAVRILVEYEGGMKDEDDWTALMFACDQYPEIEEDRNKQL